MTTNWSVKIDYDGDGYFHSGVLLTDPLNLVPNPVLWTDLGLQSMQDMTIITPETTLYGLKTLGVSALDNYYAFVIGYDETGAGYLPLPTTQGQTYRFALWARQVSGPAGTTINMRMASPVPDIYMGSNIGPYSSTLALTGSWQQLVCEFTETIYDTAGVTVDIVTHPSIGTPVLIEVTGFMLVEGTSAPTAFNAGDPSNYYDDITGYVTKSFSFKNGCRPFQVMADESKMTLTLANGSRLFSTEYEPSPLYGYLRPFRTVKVEYGGTRMWTGVTRFWQPSTIMNATEPICTLECSGMKAIYDKTFVPVEFYIDHYIHVVVADLLFKGGFVYGDNLAILDDPIFGTLGSTSLGEYEAFANVDGSNYKVGYFGDTTAQNQEDIAQQSLYQVLGELLRAERGHGFWDRNGAFNFWSRERLQDDMTVDATHTDDFEKLDYSVGTLSTNAAEVTVYPRTIDELKVIAEFVGEIPLLAGETRQFYLNYKDDTGLFAGATGVYASLPESTWTGAAGEVNTVALATGILVEVTAATATTLKTLKIYGYPVMNSYPLRVVEENLPAQERDGVRDMLSLSLKAFDDFSEGLKVAIYEANRFNWIKGSCGYVTFRHEDNGVDNAFMITTELGDQIRIVESQSGHNQCYHIIGEEHTIDINAVEHSVKWFLEPSVGPDVWLIGDVGATIGEDDLRIGHPLPD